jgi:hypothetical protein
MEGDFHSLFVEAMRLKVSNGKLGSLLQRKLNLSKNVIYRKLRGDAPFTIDEVMLLSTEFGISIDGIRGRTKAGEVPVMPMPPVTSFDGLTHYLGNAQNQLALFRTLPNFHLCYTARDLPLFYYFKHPKLACFKSVVWLDETGAGDVKLKEVPYDLLKAGRDLYEFYLTIPSTEIWTPYTLFNTLEQIGYYLDTGIINLDDALEMLENLSDIYHEVDRWLVRGEKPGKANFDLIFSPFLMVNNGAIVEYASQKTAMFSMTMVQTLTVYDPVLTTIFERSVTHHKKIGSSLRSSSQKDRVSLMAAYDAQLKSFHERWLSQARLNGGKGM